MELEKPPKPAHLYTGTRVWAWLPERYENPRPQLQYESNEAYQKRCAENPRKHYPDLLRMPLRFVRMAADGRYVCTDLEGLATITLQHITTQEAAPKLNGPFKRMAAYAGVKYCLAVHNGSPEYFRLVRVLSIFDGKAAASWLHGVALVLALDDFGRLQIMELMTGTRLAKDPCKVFTAEDGSYKLLRPMSRGKLLEQLHEDLGRETPDRFRQLVLETMEKHGPAYPLQPGDREMGIRNIYNLGDWGQLPGASDPAWRQGFVRLTQQNRAMEATR